MKVEAKGVNDALCFYGTLGRKIDGNRYGSLDKGGANNDCSSIKEDF